MSEHFSRFDRVCARVEDTLRDGKHPAIDCIYAIRDLFGRVRLVVSDKLEGNKDVRAWLESKADTLRGQLGCRAFPPEEAVLYLDVQLMQELHGSGREISTGVFFVDRLLTGSGWWSVHGGALPTSTYTLYSVKGGVGRSTTAAVLAWYLARRGENVLVVDLDLESPGISSAMLDPTLQPMFGVVDWFVEDLVGQGDQVIGDMIARPSWRHDLRGDVCIVPAHGFEPHEYLAKLGRVYLDAPIVDAGEHGASQSGISIHWTHRLKEMLEELKEIVKPTIVLLESRSGLHDIAAATVTDLNAHVLLFGTNSDASWQDYGILFKHWSDLGLAKGIRERLSVVSSLTPDIDTEMYVKQFRERAWGLFQDHLYDNVEPATEDPYGFAFEVLEEGAPHDPLPVFWTRGFAAGASLRDMEESTVEQAYNRFLKRFDALRFVSQGEGS